MQPPAPPPPSAPPPSNRATVPHSVALPSRSSGGIQFKPVNGRGSPMLYSPAHAPHAPPSHAANEDTSSSSGHFASGNRQRHGCMQWIKSDSKTLQLKGERFDPRNAAEFLNSRQRQVSAAQLPCARETGDPIAFPPAAFTEVPTQGTVKVFDFQRSAASAWAHPAIIPPKSDFAYLLERAVADCQTRLQAAVTLNGSTPDASSSKSSRVRDAPHLLSQPSLERWPVANRTMSQPSLERLPPVARTMSQPSLERLPRADRSTSHLCRQEIRGERKGGEGNSEFDVSESLPPVDESSPSSKRDRQFRGDEDESATGSARMKERWVPTNNSGGVLRSNRRRESKEQGSKSQLGRSASDAELVLDESGPLVPPRAAHSGPVLDDTRSGSTMPLNTSPPPSHPPRRSNGSAGNRTNPGGAPSGFAAPGTSAGPAACYAAPTPQTKPSRPAAPMDESREGVTRQALKVGAPRADESQGPAGASGSPTAAAGGPAAILARRRQTPQQTC
eukprot:Polyplicarium_translucidae@DN3033_c1_g1_i5.p1